VTLALPAAAVLTRLLRADLVQVLQSDFVLVAKAKGISPRRVMWRHALPNSMFTLLSSVGVQVGVIVGGAVVVETFFDLDGMGSLLLAAVLGSDLFTVQAIVAMLVVAVVITNLVIDLLYGVIDPRIRHASELR
jgi:peptide/nickel transport system permease protein